MYNYIVSWKQICVSNDKLMKIANEEKYQNFLSHIQYKVYMLFNILLRCVHMHIHTRRLV